MTAKLTREFAEKLAKICGMLGSDQDGERSAAAWQATKLIREAGFTWNDIIMAPFVKPQLTSSLRGYGSNYSTTDYANWYTKAHFCHQRLALLSAWEQVFIDDILTLNRLTEKQSKILDDIYRKVSPDPRNSYGQNPYGQTRP